MFKRPVIRLFGIWRKKAAWYLSIAEVVANTIATNSPLVAGIRACAHRLVLFNFTFHSIVKGGRNPLGSIIPLIDISVKGVFGIVYCKGCTKAGSTGIISGLI